MCMIYSCVYERVISYKCNHLSWGCNITSCFCKIKWLCPVVKLFFLTISEVSISIASSSELLSLLAVADLDGGSAYGYHNEVNRWIIVKDDGSTYDVDVDVDVEKDLASCVSDNPWKTHTFGQKKFCFLFKSHRVVVHFIGNFLEQAAAT